MDTAVLLKTGEVLAWILTGLSFCMFIWSILMKKALGKVKRIKKGVLPIQADLSEMQREAINMSSREIDSRMKNAEQIGKIAVLIAINVLILLTLLKICS